MSTFMPRKGNVFTVEKICYRFRHTNKKLKAQTILFVL